MSTKLTPAQRNMLGRVPIDFELLPFPMKRSDPILVQLETLGLVEVEQLNRPKVVGGPKYEWRLSCKGC